MFSLGAVSAAALKGIRLEAIARQSACIAGSCVVFTISQIVRGVEAAAAAAGVLRATGREGSVVAVGT